MSDLRPKSIKIMIGEKEFGIRFTVKAVDEIQDHFDVEITELATILKSRNLYKNASFILVTLVNADIDCLNDDGEKRPHIDEAYISIHLTAAQCRDSIKKIFQAFVDASPESDGEEPPPTKSE